MSRRKYPRLGESRRAKKGSRKVCRVPGCGGRAMTQQFVEFSWFRGEDEPVWICAQRNHTEEEIIAACQEELKK